MVLFLKIVTSHNLLSILSFKSISDRYLALTLFFSSSDNWANVLPSSSINILSKPKPLSPIGSKEIYPFNVPPPTIVSIPL